MKVYLADIGLILMDITNALSNETAEIIYAKSFKYFARKSATDFTRNRKMPFEEVMLFMLQSLKCSTQSALRRFFKMLNKPVFMQQQSFSEARAKIKPEAFVRLFQLSAKIMAEHCRQTWYGFHVYAIDGSKIALPADKKLLAYFGGAGRNATSPTAQASIAYDVLNDTVVDAQIAPLKTDERTLAQQHLEACREFTADGKKLFIFDRGYPSFELIEYLESNGFYYVMRVREKFNLDIDAQTDRDGYVGIVQGEKRLLIRVIKIQLDSGETETLITNLKDISLNPTAFKKLYFMRWPVETKYDVVKNKLQLENFSARTVDGIKQDFYATMYLTNAAAAALADAQAKIEEARKDKNNKYQYHANLNELIGVLKDQFILAVVEEDEAKGTAMIQNVIDEIVRSVTPTRPDRSVPRNPSPRKSKFHNNRKTNC